MSRDNFTQKVKDELAKQVAHRCSNPKHRVVTVGPAGNGKVNSIGIAAHICAASKGGPRYDKSMTEAQRKSIENGIWLCSNCAADIDRDVLRFTTDILKEWKTKAIASARTELGKQLPSDTETIETLTTALSGSPHDLPIRALENIHLAAEQTLQNLDPRFSVSTSRIDEQTKVSISANENVALDLKISDISVDELNAQYRSLNDHGEDVRIVSSSIQITGSKLFEKISQDTGGALLVSAKKTAAKQKLWFVSPDKSCIETFDDIDGSIQGGIKSFSFSGSNCGGLFSFSYKVEHEVEGDSQFKMCLEHDKWDGLLLSDLPYFEKLYDFFRRLSEGWTLFLSLEVGGIVLIKSDGNSISSSPQINYLVNLLYYTNRARIVAAALKLDIAFTSAVSFSQQQHCDLANAADLFDSPMVTSDRSNSCSCTVQADQGAQNIRSIVDADPQLCVLKLPQDSTVSVFGQEVKLPTKITKVEKVRAEIQGDLKDVKDGELVTIDWIPVDGFKMTVSFEDQSS